MISLSAFAAALAPVLALIALGYLLRRWEFLSDSVWSGIEKLTYWILFPALLIHSLGAQTLAGVPWAAMLLVISTTLLVSAAAMVIWHQSAGSVDGATFTSIFQGGVRFNTYIALALAQAIFGPEGLALGAVVVGFFSILANLLCVGALGLWGTLPDSQPVSELASRSGSAWRRLIRALALNPLIIACCMGWLLSLSGIGVPGFSGDLLAILGRASLPLGLLVVGAALRPKAVPGHLAQVGVASLVQYGLKPMVAAGMVAATGLGPVAGGVVLLALMTPTAPSSYILARQLGGDTATMASIITFQTVLAILLMPFWAGFLLS